MPDVMVEFLWFLEFVVKNGQYNSLKNRDSCTPVVRHFDSNNLRNCESCYQHIKSSLQNDEKKLISNYESEQQQHPPECCWCLLYNRRDANRYDFEISIQGTKFIYEFFSSFLQVQLQ